jgi:hypothetical protein
MKSFNEIFTERASRIIALSKISQIALEGLKQMSRDSSSAFTPMFQYMAKNIPDFHQNHPIINIPEYRVISFLDGLTLMATISEVEAFFQDLIVAILIKYPEKIRKSTIDLKSLLELNSIDDVKRVAAERFTSEMMFKRPSEYKRDIASVISLGDGLLNDGWSVFIEAKVRRDLGVHNGWVVNDGYRAKIKEVGVSPPVGRELSVDHPYLDRVRTNCIGLMTILSRHCSDKFA